MILTGKYNKKDDGNVNEEELEISKVAEDLKREFKFQSGQEVIPIMSGSYQDNTFMHQEYLRVFKNSGLYKTKFIVGGCSKDQMCGNY